MKKILSKLLVFAVATLSIYQCSDDEDVLVASTELEPALLSVDVPNNLVLDPQFASSTILNFSWQDADYGQSTEIRYILQMDDSSDFSEPVTVSSTSQRSIALTVSQLNNAVGEAGLPPFETSTIFARVRSTIGTEGALEQFSNPISFDVFPYTTIKPQLFVVGEYQANSGYGSENADAPTIASSEFGNETNYEGFVYFNAPGEFQLHRAGFVGDYVEGNPIYGNNGDTVSEGASGMFTVPTEGYYLIRVDLDAQTISMTETDWAIAGPGGPSGGWPDNPPDADMTYDVQNRIWVFDNATTSSGEYKFRANDDWGINIGTDNDNNGSLDFDGPNFTNGIGAKRFVLDLSSPRAYTSTISAQ